jgi:signal transduction histidine kinase/CheY-like chemotaxis protein
MMFRHRLLLRQIRKHLGPNPDFSPDTRSLLAAIEAAYDQFDTDRKLVERSMELSSRELTIVNARLREQNEHHLEVLNRLRDSIRALEIEGTSGLGEEDDLLQVSALLQKQVRERQRAELERQQLERKVQETQKLESLGVLAGGIAHDFNNILTIILGNASLARLQLPDDSPAQESLNAIAHGSRRAADLCKQMLAYSGKGRFELQNLSLNRLVEETTHLLQISISKKAGLRFNLFLDLPMIKADATQIRQVIMNLVINASEAIGERSGVISLSTGLAAVGRAPFGGIILTPELPEGTYVYLEVVDSGCGMTAETQSKIFDPFFTTKFTGRGLGLAAVLGIVRGHGGALKLQSEPGRGTKFRLLFPVSDAAEEEAATSAGAKTAWRGEGCVLVADDEESVRHTVGAMLRALGLEVVLAADGREAVDRFRQEPDRFTLVLLDLTMPHLDGKQAFVEMRRIRSEQRVVLMSGFDEQEAAAQFGWKALACFLHKPFANDDLVNVVQRVLEGGTLIEVDGGRA